MECILYWLSKKRGGGEEENKFLRLYMSENAIILPSFLVCLGIELCVRNDFPLFWRLYQFLFPCCCWDFWRHYDSWSLYMICPFSLEAYKIFTLFLAFLNFCDVPLRASVFIHYAGPLAGPLSPWNSSLIAGSPLDLFHWWLLFSQFFLEAPLIGHGNSVLVLCTYFLSLSLFKITFNFYSNYLQMSSTLYQKPSISFSFFLYWFIGAFIYSLSVHFSK